jgi:hypothetical protein
MNLVRMRATWVVEYDADIEAYGADDALDAALMDEDGDDPIALMADGETVRFVVEPIVGG